jgi:hypothetical protein
MAERMQAGQEDGLPAAGCIGFADDRQVVQIWPNPILKHAHYPC